MDITSLDNKAHRKEFWTLVVPNTVWLCYVIDQGRFSLNIYFARLIQSAASAVIMVSWYPWYV